MIKDYSTILIDMYGVIIKESKGNFIPYTYDSFSESEHERIESIINPLFSKAQKGEIDSFEFLSHLGFENPENAMKDYIQTRLTLDKGFVEFAEKIKDKYQLVLLSNDVGDWSRYITDFWGLDKYFSHEIISADINLRKPDLAFFDKALEIIGKSAHECIFVDNSVQNLLAAEEVGISPIHFNRDNEHYYGMVVNDFNELYNLIA